MRHNYCSYPSHYLFTLTSSASTDRLPFVVSCLFTVPLQVCVGHVVQNYNHKTGARVQLNNVWTNTFIQTKRRTYRTTVKFCSNIWKTKQTSTRKLAKSNEELFKRCNGETRSKVNRLKCCNYMLWGSLYVEKVDVSRDRCTKGW